jgi:LacI family transcriptional regulator
MELSKNRVTIFDVAKTAGVSISTVSRVMNGNYPVTGELRIRVEKAITELGYMPDSVARGMKSKHRYVIGYVCSDITNRHFTMVSKTIDDILGPLGYSLIVCSTDSNQEKESRAIKMLLSNRVDGLIINTSGKNDDYISSISQQLPVVLLHRRIKNSNFSGDYVGSDNYQACAQLAKYAFSMGHREIGIITSDQSISTFRERTQGFVETMHSLGVSIDNSYIITTPYTEEGGYSAFGKLLQAHPEITLVAIMNNATTLGSFLYVREHNILVPNTISILSFGEILNANLLFVNPVFMAQKPTEVGIKAAHLMLERLEEPNLKSREAVIEAQFTEGSSVKDLS